MLLRGFLLHDNTEQSSDDNDNKYQGELDLGAGANVVLGALLSILNSELKTDDESCINSEKQSKVGASLGDTGFLIKIDIKFLHQIIPRS